MKRLRLIIFSLFLLFIGLISAKAEDMIFELGPTNPSEPIVFGKPTTYINHKCPIGTLKYFDIEETANEGQYRAKLKSGLTENSGSEILECTYTNKKENDRLIGQGGTIKYKFNYGYTVMPQILNVNQTISKYDPYVHVSRDYMVKENNGITSVNITLGAENFDVDCEVGSAYCVFKLKESAYNQSEGADLVGSAVIKYKAGGVEHTINLNIKMLGFLRVYALNRGTCNFNSDIWTFDGEKYVANFVGMHLPLVSCSNPDSAMREKFWGWVYDPGDHIGANIQLANVCKTFPRVEGDMVTAELVEKGIYNYVPCYETPGDYITLSTAGGHFDIPSNAKELLTNVYQIDGEPGSNFTLPVCDNNKCVPYEETEKVSYSFDGWVSNYNKQLFPGGASVPMNGTSYYARFTRTNKLMHTEFENGAIYGGATQMYRISGVELHSCSSDGRITVSDKDGGCEMVADNVESEDTATVSGIGPDGKEYKIKMRIIPRKGTTEADPNGNDYFIIKYDSYLISGYKSGKYDEKEEAPEEIDDEEEPDTADPTAKGKGKKIDNPTCQKYSVTKHGGSSETTIIGQTAFAQWEGLTYLFQDEFSAKCTDSKVKDNNTYAGICVDFGPAAPVSTDEFVPDKSMNSDLKKLLLYALSQYKEELTGSVGSPTAKRTATTFAARLHTGKTGSSIQCVVGSDGKHNVNVTVCKMRQALMRYMGPKVYSGTKISSFGGQKIAAGNWAGNFVISDSSVINNTQTLIDSYKSSSTKKAEKVKLDKKKSKFDLKVDGSNYTVTVSGQILNLPSEDMEKLEAKMDCSKGKNLTCDNAKINDDGTFEFKVSYTEEHKKETEKDGNIVMNVTFESFSAESSVVLLRVPNANIQRIAIFKKEQAYAFGFTFKTDGTPNKDVEPTCDDAKSKEEWLAMGCCDFITDQEDSNYKEIYDEYCADKDVECSRSNFSDVCEPQMEKEYDLYQIQEAKNSNGEKQFSVCIVDVEKKLKNDPEARSNTEEFKDVVGNEIVITDYNKDTGQFLQDGAKTYESGNKYCRVSCEEDWDFRTSAFKNFIGIPEGTSKSAGAVKAGSYFQIDQNLYIAGARTCVTTYIDYQRYDDDVYVLSGNIIASTNAFKEFTIAYENLFENTSKKDKDKSTYNRSEDEDQKCENGMCEYYKDLDIVVENVRPETVTDYSNILGYDRGVPIYGQKTVYYADMQVDPNGQPLKCPMYSTNTDKNPKEANGAKYDDPANDGKTEGITLNDNIDHKIKSDSGDHPGDKKPTQGPFDSYEEASGADGGKAQDGYCKTPGGAGQSPTDVTEDMDDQETIWEIFKKEIQYESVNDYYLTFNNENHRRDNKFDAYDNWVVGSSKKDGDDNHRYEKPEKGVLEKLIDDRKDEYEKFYTELKDIADHMGYCQNFYLNDTADDKIHDDAGANYHYGPFEKGSVYGSVGAGNAYKPSETLGKVTEYAVEGGAREIKSPYKPDVRYMYEEYEYMTLIGKDNYLIPYKVMNDNAGGKSGENDWCVDVTNDKVTGSEDGADAKLQICKNELKIEAYNLKVGSGAKAWENDSKKGKDYEDTEKFEITNKSYGNLGDNVKTKKMQLCNMGTGGYKYSDVSSDTKCIDTEFYYYEVNYIKQTLKNGGYYRNKGDFYVSNYSDIKVHADNIEDATKKAQSPYSGDHWSILGGVNVFPVSMDTRRNIYQYMYSFGDIGIYLGDEEKGIPELTLGRIMGGYLDPATVTDDKCEDGLNCSTLTGDETGISVAPTVSVDHIHTCFYEVYEHICLCCGYPVSTAVTFPSGVDTDIVSGYPSNTDYPMSNNEDSYSGTLGFYNSTVSLHDLTGKGGEGTSGLGSNWQNGDQFYAYGNTYETNKGGELAEAIAAVGENIYDFTPEYSYLLTPSAIKSIRLYNERYGYEPNISRLEIIGGACAIAYDSEACNVPVTGEGGYPIDRFIHYGSKFLRNDAKDSDLFGIDDYVTDSTVRYLSRRNNICTISSGQLGKTPGAAGSSTTIDMYDSSYRDCAWVDYVMTGLKAKRGDDKKEGVKDKNIFRLAFK